MLVLWFVTSALNSQYQDLSLFHSAQAGPPATQASPWAGQTNPQPHSTPTPGPIITPRTHSIGRIHQGVKQPPAEFNVMNRADLAIAVEITRTGSPALSSKSLNFGFA